MLLIELAKKSIFAIHDINGLSKITNLKLNFTHLNERKFLQHFNNMIEPMCSYG